MSASDAPHVDQRLRIAMVAGEASGDLLGARVITALQARCPQLALEGIGGPQMQAQGLRSVFAMERLSVMGLIEPLKRLPELLHIRRSVYRQWRDNPPDLFLGIDAPDFNLHLEHRLRRVGIPTAHLVSPSVWAWRSGRIGKIRKAVDLMLCLFPFEQEIYQRHGIAQRFVGHPLADEIPLRSDRTAMRASLGLPEAGVMLALLPGSRAAEIQALTPLFLSVAQTLWQEDRSLSFVLPAANAQRQTELGQHLRAYPQLPITLLQGRSREAMAAADAVLLASGTATLEAALLKRPMVVAYRMGTWSWLLLSKMVRSRYVALPNILAGQEVVPELLQDAATPEALCAALRPLLAKEGASRVQLKQFDDIHRALQLNCAEQVADALLTLVAHGGKQP